MIFKENLLIRIDTFFRKFPVKSEKIRMIFDNKSMGKALLLLNCGLKTGLKRFETSKLK